MAFWNKLPMPCQQLLPDSLYLQPEARRSSINSAIFHVSHFAGAKHTSSEHHFRSLSMIQYSISLRQCTLCAPNVLRYQMCFAYFVCVRLFKSGFAVF